jgi:serine/threonine protein kinase
MPVEMTACPNCRTAVSVAALGRLGGVCISCLSSFVLEGEPLESSGPVLPIAPGSTFHGLEVLEVLGWGGMGVVYKCRQPELDRFVALKVLNPALASNDEFARRFNGEARALAALNHPNIVQVYDFGQERSLYFLIMEFVDGVPLRALMRDGRVAPERTLEIVAGVCDALDYAHSKGVVHRDIKPENILIPRAGGLKIADFGLAKMAEGDQPATRASRVLGTPHYMAPEILTKAPVDHRADLYSLGVVFYEMLTGQIPVGRFPVPSSHPGVDKRLDEIVLKALERSPEARYANTRALKSRVESVDLAPKSKRGGVLFAAFAAAVIVVGVFLLKSPPVPSIPPPPSGIARWTWVNRGDIAETTGTELSVPPYRDRALMTATPVGRKLGDHATLRFQLRYEVNPKDEPWIILMFDGPTEDSKSRAFMLFPEGGHEVALAHLEINQGWSLLDKNYLPANKPSPEKWHAIEVTWDGLSHRVTLKVDGETAYDRQLGDDIDLSGPWRFGFGGAAKSVRIRDVNVTNLH